MDFQLARETGYYFDRCIDLTFYDTDYNFIGILRTPSSGLKPTITIKGLLIEGGYSIDSYISVQNMAFDIDVAYIGYIKARMYYKGLEEAVGNSYWNKKIKNGHTILFRVLYADQEKEPPNRCVRFQCVVASKDTTLFNTPMYISGGTAKYLGKNLDPNNLTKVETDKLGSVVPLKQLCEELIKIYNEGISSNSFYKKNTELYNLLKISLLEIDEPLENLNVKISSGEYTLGDFIRQLNSGVTETNANGFSYNSFKIVIDRGTMRVSTPVPDDWKKIALSKGYTESTLDKFYNDTYLSVKTKAYGVFNGVLKPENYSPIIPLNYVKSATRSECIIYVETLFDDRITPGCHVAIKSNAIMGKKFGSTKGTRGGSRILNYFAKSQPVVFRNTGKIEYLFSTTEDSYMKLQGPVDESEEAKAWASNPGAMNE